MITGFFAAIGLFFKEKVFSTTGIFLLTFAAIFTIFILYNSDTILEKFGFETAATVKVKLTKSQEDLRKVIQTNDKLVKDLEISEKHNTQVIRQLEKYELEKEKASATVIQIKEVRKAKSRPIEESLKKKTIVTDTTITLPIEELDKLSMENVTSIHDAFNQLGFSNNSPPDQTVQPKAA